MPEKIEPNSLDRFVKSSPRLVLERFTSCEVPAGCGGVVYRWRRADRDVSMALALYTPGEVKAWVDDEEVLSTHIDLVRGPHVLGLYFPNARPDTSLFLCAATVANPSGMDDSRFFHSLDDQTWLYRLSDPGKGWMAPDADEGWQQLEKGAAFPDISERSLGYWRHQRIRQARAVPLAVPGGLPAPLPVWVRRAFVLGGKS